MKDIIKLSLIATLAISSSLYADNSVKKMFDDAKVSGEVRSLYSAYNNDNDTDSYASAVGTALKYELASLKGFNGAVAFRTSHTISSLSGEDDKYNDELSGEMKDYTKLTQLYLNYKYDDFNFRAGRQILETPLADSDDIRMMPNSFRACVATYDIDKISLTAGHIVNWQGADAGLEREWSKTGEDGVNFAGAVFESDTLSSNLWFYNIANFSDANNAFYADVTGIINFGNSLELVLSAQYLKESELDNSKVEANIYGAMAEFSFKNLGMMIAYNSSSKEKGKHSFSGFGGGTLYTNMDTMILDEITEDRDAQAFVIGISYEVEDFNLAYAYGSFQGDANTQGEKAEITEHDISVEYTPTEDLTLSATYILDENKESTTSTDFNNDNVRVFASYSF